MLHLESIYLACTRPWVQSPAPRLSMVANLERLRQVDLREFEDNLLYMVRSRIAKAMWRHPASKNQ